MWPTIRWTGPEEIAFVTFRSASNEALMIARSIDQILFEHGFTQIRLLDFGSGTGEVEMRIETGRESSVSVEPSGNDWLVSRRQAGRTHNLDELVKLFTQPIEIDVFLFCRVLGYISEPVEVFNLLKNLSSDRSIWIAVVSAPSGDQYHICKKAFEQGLTDRLSERTSAMRALLEDQGINYGTKLVRTAYSVDSESKARIALAFFLGVDVDSLEVDQLQSSIWRGHHPTELTSHHTVFYWTMNDPGHARKRSENDSTRS